MKKSFAPILAASVLTLTACGGGGGDSSSSDVTYSGPTSAVTIDSTNMGKVSSTALDSSTSIYDAGLPLISGVAADGESVEYNLFEITSQLTRKTLEESADASGGSIVAGVTQSYDCTGGGTVVYSGDLDGVQNGTYAQGDSVSATFNSCVEGDTTINGSMTFTISSLVGQLWGTVPWEAGMTVVFDQLSVDGNTMLIDGDFTFTVGENTVNGEYASITGTSLFVKAGADEALMETFNLSYALKAGVATSNSDFTYSGTDIGGSITVDTTTPFVTDTNTANYPHEGAMTITGNGGAWIKLTAVDATQVYIEWDIDPIDGTPDNNATVAWSALASWEPAAEGGGGEL